MTPPRDIDVDFAAEAERSRLRGDAHAALRIAEAGLANAPSSAGGRMALALALIDLGDLPRAREELARGVEREVAAAVPAVPRAPHADFSGTLADDEIETAFAAAETNPDEMMSANRVVERTLAGAAFDTLETDFDVANHPTYATETMASLLADQGRADAAGALRESLSAPNESVPNESVPSEPVPSEPVPSEPVPNEPVPNESVPNEGRAFFGDYPNDSTLENAAGLLDAAVGPEHAKRLQIVATLEGWLHNLKRNAEFDARARVAGAAGGAA